MSIRFLTGEIMLLFALKKEIKGCSNKRSEYITAVDSTVHEFVC